MHVPLFPQSSGEGIESKKEFNPRVNQITFLAEKGLCSMHISLCIVYILISFLLKYEKGRVRILFLESST